MSFSLLHKIWIIVNVPDYLYIRTWVKIQGRYTVPTCIFKVVSPNLEDESTIRPFDNPTKLNVGFYTTSVRTDTIIEESPINNVALKDFSIVFSDKFCGLADSLFINASLNVSYLTIICCNRMQDAWEISHSLNKTAI